LLVLESVLESILFSFYPLEQENKKRISKDARLERFIILIIYYL